MRIRIFSSALKHGITEDEIRNVIEYPLWTARVAPRLPGTQPQLFIGQANQHEPPIEVLADNAAGEHIVFHAMLLRRSTLAELDANTAAALHQLISEGQRR